MVTAVTKNNYLILFKYNQQDAMLYNILYYCRNDSPTLAVAASKLDIYLMLCVQFLSS